ncbi:MAG: hypothetical protein AAF443_00035 [Chlamydiota bacterium]
MRSFKALFRLNQCLFFINIAVFITTCTALGFVFFGRFGSDSIEARQIVLRSQSGVPTIVLQGDEAGTLLTLNDSAGNARLQLQGGDFPALMMKNSEQEIIGTFFPLKGGGGALGLGNQAGEMATFIRGGDSPGIGFYRHAQVPQVAMGIAQEVPHLLLFPMTGREGMVVDGSQSASLLFFDNEGQVPVALSRYGLYQSAEEESDQEEQDKKEMSFKDLAEESSRLNDWRSMHSLD